MPRRWTSVNSRRSSRRRLEFSPRARSVLLTADGCCGTRRISGVTSIYRVNQTIGTLYHFASPAASGMNRGRERRQGWARQRWSERGRGNNITLIDEGVAQLGRDSWWLKFAGKIILVAVLPQSYKRMGICIPCRPSGMLSTNIAPLNKISSKRFSYFTCHKV